MVESLEEPPTTRTLEVKALEVFFAGLAAIKGFPGTEGLQATLALATTGWRKRYPVLGLSNI